MLSENIRWVGQITLEGERLTADDIVLHRDSVVGARLDKPGVRASFVLVVLLLIAAAMVSITLFLQTLQFFDPDYTRFALSLIPLVALAWASYKLRPRHHLTVMIMDGSALVLTSRDGNFLSLCLEAFERLWADKSRARASLYLHAGHRSVDFGPSGALTLDPTGEGDVNNPLPPMPELPMFDDNEEAAATVVSEDLPTAASDDGVRDELPPLPPPPVAVDDHQETDISVPPPVPSVAEHEPDTPVEPELSIADLLGTDDQPSDDPSQSDVPDEAEQVEPETVDAVAEIKADDDDRLDETTAGEDSFELAIAPEADEPVPDETEQAAEPEEPAGPLVEASAFDTIRPKVATLSRLLRDRPDFAALIDAVDVVDKHVDQGCETRLEAEAFAEAIAFMRGPLGVYPAALQVVEAIAQAGELDRFTASETSEA